MIATESPFPLFFDTDGDPLDSGFVYLGVANQNPETAAIPAWWDSAGTQPAAQPIRTLNGYPMRNGTPATIFTAGAYSITVKNRHGVIVYYAASSLEFSSTQQFTDQTNSAMGSSLIGYKAPFTNSVGRPVSAKLQETVSAGDFGLATTNTGAQNDAAIALAIAYAIAQGGLTIHIARGAYNFSTTINFAGANNTRITGDGVDSTILRINHATADFLVCGAAIYQSIDNLTLTSSVTRTAGAMITGGYWRRGLIERIKITRHFNGIHLTSFEECYVTRCSIVDPSGPGAAIIAGTAAATNQGANLTLISLFIRGNDDTINGSPPVTGLYGIVAYDIQAIYAFSCDIGGLVNNCMKIEPTTAIENCFFNQCYFDTTVSGENIVVLGAGVKKAFMFTGCWIAGAGRYTLPGTAGLPGLRLANAGSYQDWVLTGCRFLAISGQGLSIETNTADVTVTGCVFVLCAANPTSVFTSIYISPPSAQLSPVSVTGCKFQPVGTSTSDIFVNALGDGNTITGNIMPKGLVHSGGAKFGAVSGNSDAASNSIASAATIQPAATRNFYFVTGTTNVGGLFPTYVDHVINFVSVSGFTWLNGGGLALRGGANFVAAAGNTLTLQCVSGGTWREVGRDV